MLGTVPVPVRVVLEVEALDVLVEGADVLLRGFNNTHDQDSLVTRTALRAAFNASAMRPSWLMAEDLRHACTAASISARAVSVRGRGFSCTGVQPSRAIR